MFLEDNLDDFDPGEVRGAVLYTLGQLKLNTWTVIDQMLNGLTRSDPYVRIMAARGLGELGNKHPTILNALIRYMDEGTFMFEGSINDRNAAVKSIGKLGVDILPDIIGKYLKASDEKSRHNLFLVMIAIKNLNPDKKERIFEVIRQSGLPQNFKELWNELSANDYALINEYSELISSQGTSRTGLENAIDTGLPVKRSSRSDGHYKDDDFSKQKDLLSLTTLIVLSELIHYLHTGQGKSDLGQIISRDLLDWGSEAGGLVVYKNGKLSFERYEPRCRGDNCRYIISEKLDADSPHALFSWHNHATKLLGNAEIAGPSGWHSAQDVSGGGDIGTAEQENKDGVVITYLGENKFNVNYYTYDGIVINLGDYSWDTSKVPLLTKEKIGELEKVYSENVVRRSDVIDNELERLLITTKNDCDSGAIPGAACSAMQTALETTNYDDKVNKIIMAQSALATPSIVAPDISKPPTDAEKSLNQKFGTLINKAQRPLDESVLEETLAARDYTTPRPCRKKQQRQRLPRNQ